MPPLHHEQSLVDEERGQIENDVDRGGEPEYENAAVAVPLGQTGTLFGETRQRQSIGTSAGYL